MLAQIENINIKYTIDVKNGVCQVKDSYKIKDEKIMSEFIRAVMCDPIFNKRTITSYVREWKAHNLLYIWNIKRESTRDVDLDIKEPLWRRFGYLILSLLYK